MTFLPETTRVNDLLPATLLHQHDESWNCIQGCGEWPCTAYRVSIRIDYADDRVGLAVLMAAYLLDFLRVRGAQAQTVADRFMGWCRAPGRRLTPAEVMVSDQQPAIRAGLPTQRKAGPP